MDEFNTNIDKNDEFDVVETQDLVRAITDKDDTKLSDLLDKEYPIDLAIAMEDLDQQQILEVYERLDDEKLAELIEQTDEDYQADMVNLLSNQRIIKIFSHMSKDDIVDILGSLKIGRRKEIINLMTSGESKTITTLLGYPEDSAGGIMTTEYVVVSSQLNIDETIRKLRQIAPKTEVIETIFVVNNRRQLIGTVDLRDILVRPNTELLDEFLNDNIRYVYPETDQEEVSYLASKYDLKAIPVVNHNKQMLGIITIDDIIDVINEEHSEDLLQLSGVSAEEDINNSVIQSLSLRIPWLLVNLVTAFLAAWTVSQFESTIAKVTALAAAMPIVTGMGGNSGSQELSVVIRAISLKEIELKEALPYLLKQIVLGILQGIIIGVIAGIALYFMYGSFFLGVIITLAMIFNILLGCVMGLLIPLILKHLNIDPAIASSIFITTCTDTLGFLVFLGLASIFIERLI